MIRAILQRGRVEGDGRIRVAICLDLFRQELAIHIEIIGGVRIGAGAWDSGQRTMDRYVNCATLCDGEVWRGKRTRPKALIVDSEVYR